MANPVNLAEEFAPPETAESPATQTTNEAVNLSSEFDAPARADQYAVINDAADKAHQWKQAFRDGTPEEQTLKAESLLGEWIGRARLKVHQIGQAIEQSPGTAAALEPVIKLPRMDEPTEETKAIIPGAGIQAGIYNGLAPILSSFTSPLNIGTMGMFGGLMKVAQGAGPAATMAKHALTGLKVYFGATMAEGAGGAAGEASVNPSVENVTSALAQSALATVAGGSAVADVAFPTKGGTPNADTKSGPATEIRGGPETPPADSQVASGKPSEPGQPTGAGEAGQAKEAPVESAAPIKLPEDTRITVMEMGGKRAVQIDVPAEHGERPVFSGSPEEAQRAGYDVDPATDFHDFPEGQHILGEVSRSQLVDEFIAPEIADFEARLAAHNETAIHPADVEAAPLSAEETAAMRAEETSQVGSAGSDLLKFIKGKLPHPETAAEGGEALSGELKMLRDHFVKPDKTGRLNYSQAAQWFTKKGQYASLEKLVESANESLGTNFQTPREFIDAVDSALREKAAGVAEPSVKTEDTTGLPKSEEEAQNLAEGDVTDFGKLAEEPKGEAPIASSGEPENFGIAARVSEARAESGKIAGVEPGGGISTEESVAHGRDLLEAGKDPQAAVDEFTKDKKISADSIALVRAHGEKLAKLAGDAADKFGVDSPEYKAAAKADSDWIKAIKPMQTEWHKIGQAQQGETEIDTGTFHGLARGYTKLTGKEFTPEQATAAKELVGKVKSATEDADTAKQKVFETIAKGLPESPKPRQNAISKFIDERAEAARARIKARLAEGRLYAGIDPQELADYAEVGAQHFKNGIRDFGEWSKKMVGEFGGAIREHLKGIFDIVNREADKIASSHAVPGSVADIWRRAKAYVDGGETDYEEIRHKIATDTGLPVEEVTKKLTQPKSAREITNEMYVKLAQRRQMVQDAKNWLQNQQTPGWLRFMRSVPRIFFIDKVLGHGTVGMITHAGLNIFHPQAWGTYWPNFMRQFKLLGWHDQGAYHEMMMENLTHDPNYITAKRAGLANDPMRYTDDYQRNWVGTWLEKVGLTGNRGFDALKLFRQARFNQIWNGMPDSMKTPDNAKLIADGVNHATGIVRERFPEWSNWAFFAPKLEGSRWAWMLADPLKAGRIFSEWNKSTPAEQQFALSELKQKATITGVYLSLLAANQGLLSATGSKDEINFTNPRRGDFLAFKGAGHQFGIISPLLGVVRLFANMLHASIGSRSKFEQMESRSDQMATVAKGYVRGKLSPFASFATDLATQSDFQGRPLPFSDDKVPSYLKKQGVQKYTYGEYAAQQFTPIPVSEAVREVWAKQGMDESLMNHWLWALSSAAIMGSTGARVSRDTHQLPEETVPAKH